MIFSIKNLVSLQKLKVIFKNQYIMIKTFLNTEQVISVKIKLIILFLFLFSIDLVFAETIFIFNPETRITRIRKVKSGIENHLKSKGIHTDVYIFVKSEDFENSVSRLKPDLAIVSSYYYSLMASKYKWHAVLSGHKDGEKIFTKVLVTLKSLNNPQQLINKNLATVSLGASSLSFIDSLLPSGLSTENIHVVSVSKDIDAMIALAFEQVEAAIVTIASFNKLKKNNPVAVKNLHIMQKLNPIQYPKIAVFPKAESIEKLTSALKEMPYNGNTKIVLRFFGVTGFTHSNNLGDNK